MGASFANSDAVLKNFYLEPSKEQLNNGHWLLAQIEKNTQDVEGRYAVLAPHVSRNHSVGARGGAGAKLPGRGAGATVGEQGFTEQRIPTKKNYGSIRLEGDILKAMKSDKGSFLRAMDSEMRVVNDLKVDVNRQIWGTSDGVIATAGVTTAANVVVLAAATTSTQMRYFEVGMRVDIGTLADVNSVAAFRSITAVDSASKTITISGAAVTTDGTHRVYRSGLVEDGAATGIELTGIQTIVSATGTLFNINPATFPSWASTVLANGGTPRAISENLVTRLLMDVEIAGGNPTDGRNVLACSDGVYRAYTALLTPLKRFINTIDMKGGHKAIEATAGTQSVPVVFDRYAPNASMWNLDMDELVEYQMCDWEWMEQDGAILSRIDGEDAYGATLFKYHELATPRRNAHGRLADLTEA